MLITFDFFLTVGSIEKKKVILYMLLSMAAVFFQYASLISILAFLKLEIDSLHFISVVNSFFSNFNYTQGVSIDIDLHEHKLGYIFISMFVFFYGVSGVLFLIGRRISSKIIRDSRGRLFSLAKKKGKYSDKKNRKALSALLLMHRRYLQMIPPFCIIALGACVFSIIDIGVLYILLGMLLIYSLLIVVFYRVFSYKGGGSDLQHVDDPSYESEASSGKARLIGQIAGVSIFGSVLLFALYSDFSVEELVITVVLGRIVLGSLVNFISPLVEIISQVPLFKIAKNNKLV